MHATARWPMFNQVRHRQELMDHMMETLGVDVLTAVRLDHGQAFVNARTRCRDCLHESECRNWLDLPQGLPSLPDFCPNARFFRRVVCSGDHGLWRERRSN